MLIAAFSLCVISLLWDTCVVLWRRGAATSCWLGCSCSLPASPYAAVVSLVSWTSCYFSLVLLCSLQDSRSRRVVHPPCRWECSCWPVFSSSCCTSLPGVWLRQFSVRRCAQSRRFNHVFTRLCSRRCLFRRTLGPGDMSGCALLSWRFCYF